MSLELVFTNAAGIFFILLTLSVGILILIQGPKKASNITFFLLNLSLVIYYISHLLGINASNAETARWIFMFNLVNITITTSITHFLYSTFGKKTLFRKIMVILSYCIGGALILFFITHPSTFMLLPGPKLYLPFYYARGPLYWMMTVYFIFFAAYVFFDLIQLYITAENNIERNRVKYPLVGITFAYIVGGSALLLVYNIPFDPFYSLFFGLYTLPFAYAILEYDLLDIHVVAKRALWYASGSIVVSILFILINIINNILVSTIPRFPFWFIPFFSGCGAVVLGGYVWNKIKEVDKLKYEFITVITHKFRTPLTHIKWSVDNIKPHMSEDEAKGVSTSIDSASNHISELTDLLVGLEKSQSLDYNYVITPIDIQEVVEETLHNEHERIKEKDITIRKEFSDETCIAEADKSRLGFALQILIENAISYTDPHGTITVGLKKDKKHIIISYTDTGIGITREELPYIFKQFFRGKNARLADTEGMGIGLTNAKNIIERHHGKILVSSGGMGKGSTFLVVLPISS